MKTRACVALMVIAALAGCGQNRDQQAASKTVSSFYAALKRHDAAAACGLVSPTFATAVFRASGEGGKSCVAALRDVFRRVAASSNPHAFDSVPKVISTTAHGDRAAVVIGRGYQRLRVGLTRYGDRWLITASPGLG